jgi:hypothetical protein
VSLHPDPRCLRATCSWRVRRSDRPRETGGRACEWDGRPPCPSGSPGSRTPRSGSSRPEPSLPARHRSWRRCGRRATTPSAETSAERAGSRRRAATTPRQTRTGVRARGRPGLPRARAQGHHAQRRSIRHVRTAPIMPIIPAAPHAHHSDHAGVGFGKCLALEVHLRAGRKACEIEQQVRALARRQRECLLTQRLFPGAHRLRQSRPSVHRGSRPACRCARSTRSTGAPGATRRPPPSSAAPGRSPARGRRESRSSSPSCRRRGRPAGCVRRTGDPAARTGARLRPRAAPARPLRRPAPGADPPAAGRPARPCACADAGGTSTCPRDWSPRTRTRTRDRADGQAGWPSALSGTSRPCQWTIESSASWFAKRTRTF